MIKKFNTFNEAKQVKGSLLEDVKNAFAFLVDENPSIKITEPKTGQVNVVIYMIVSPSRKYTIEEYADIQNRWNEIVQDTWVAVQQVTHKGDISVDTFLDGGILRLAFFNTSNNEIFKINTKTIQVSKVNLLKTCKFPSCDFKIMNTANQAVFKFEFNEQQSVDELTDLIDNLRYITNKYGINISSVWYGGGPSFYLDIYFKIPVPNSTMVGLNKKFILKDIV